MRADNLSTLRHLPTLPERIPASKAGILGRDLKPVSAGNAPGQRGQRRPASIRELVKRRIKIRAVKGFKIPKVWEKNGWQQWQIDLPGTDGVRGPIRAKRERGAGYAK